MRYVFLGLMSVFAVLYAATVMYKGSFAAKLTIKSIASMSFVLIAFAGRLGAARPYYSLILAGLCLSLAGDVLRVFSGRETAVASGIAFMLAHVGYIAAFFIYAAPAWHDAVLFALFAGLGAVLFVGKEKHTGLARPFAIVYAIVLCAMAAKAVSMLFTHGTSPLYTAFAALGGALFALSNLAIAHANLHPDEKFRTAVLSTLTYYAAQALIALSIAL